MAVHKFWSHSSDLNLSHLICPTGPLSFSLSLVQTHSLHTMITRSPHHPCLIISQSEDHRMIPIRYDRIGWSSYPVTGPAASPPARPASGAQLASSSTGGGSTSATVGSSAFIGRTSPSSSPIGWEFEEEEALVKGQSVLHPSCCSLIDLCCSTEKIVCFYLIVIWLD